MNLQQSRVVLRPRRTSELAELAMRWQRAVGGRLFVRLWCLTVLPVCMGIGAIGWLNGLVPGQTWLLGIAAASLTEAVFTVACGQLMFSTDVTVRSVLAALRPRIPALLSVFALVTFLGASAMFTILFVPAWLSRTLYFREVLLLEQMPFNRTMGRASRLIHPRAVTTAALLWLVSLAGIFIFENLGGATLSFVLQLGRPFGELSDGLSLSAWVGLFLMVPFIATLRFLSYIDRRTRADGWDVQVRLMAVAQRMKRP